MKNIIIIGGNSGARTVYEVCILNKFNIIGFASNFTKNWHNITPNILGSIEDQHVIDLIAKKENDYFVATGDNKIREQITSKIIEKYNKNPINVIHPSAILSEYIKIGYGNLIMSNVVINNGTNIGNSIIINTGSIIEHDNIINDYSQIAPSVTCCGYVNIGKYSFIGANSIIIPNIIIENDSTIGAGTVVIKNVESYCLIVGNPGIVKKYYNLENK